MAASDGTIWMGTINGLVSFNPQIVHPNTFVPPVYITGMYVQGRETPFTADGVQLPYRSNAVSYTHLDVYKRQSKISEDQIFYCNQRGIPTEDAIGLIVNGYAKEVLNKLPMEFAVEAQKLLTISLEGSVG